MTDADENGFEFEAALEELEDIVDRLDREGVGLDEAISLFERGIERLGSAKEWLASVSGRIEELITTSTGKFETAPLEEIDREDVSDDGGAVGGATDPGASS